MKKYLKLIILFVVGFLGGLAGALLVFFVQPTETSQVTTNTSSATSVENVQYTNETSTTKAVKKIQEAVVSVINYQKGSASGENVLFGSTDTSDELTIAGEGSGVIYKKENGSAYIVTNNHVVNGAEKIDIQLSSGEKVEGQLVGADTYSDIAVIKISDAKVTTVASFANSDSITVGEIAIAIGSPLGTNYANSVTQGIVSSLSRTVTSKSEDGQTISTNAIQTDTAINPGNSGGPLINIEGQVIGITSSKITSNSTNVAVEGMGFAIPSNDVVAIINHLEKNGKVIRPALGIRMVNISDLTSSQLATANLATSKITSGVLVVSTQTGLPADGKLKQYDVITAINDEKVDTTSDLQSALYKHAINDTVTLTVIRDGKEMKIDIKLTHSTDDLSAN